MIIKTVTVIGVTGTMGANVAGIFASFGDAKVYCVGRDIEKVKITIPRIVKSVKADAIAKNLVPADFSMLEKCVAESDLVFESSKEDIGVKKEIAAQVAKTLQPHAVSCTGSSGLSITEIANCYPDGLKEHFFGVHMFNPPYSMSLCELTPTAFSDKAMQTELKEYLSNKLIRTVVEVKDSPAFLGNRIGFQFINEALRYAERFKDNGGIDYIDAILGSFTGRSMAPLTTSDFVGLDVHKAIVDNIYENTHDYAHETFVLPEFVQKLIEQKKLGRKSGGGLYQRVKYENGLVRQTVLDINTGLYRDVIPYVYAKQFNITKLKWIVSGGSTGQESIRNGVYNLEGKAADDDIIIIHDGIRPLVDETVLTDVIRKAQQYGNAVTSLPYNEQIFVIDDDISTTKFIPRETLRRVSTPQAYRFDLLDSKYHEAYEKKIGIYGSHYTNTMMVELGVRLYFAAGSDKNIKLTTKDDLEMFKAYLKSDKDNWLK